MKKAIIIWLATAGIIYTKYKQASIIFNKIDTNRTLIKTAYNNIKNHADVLTNNNLQVENIEDKIEEIVKYIWKENLIKKNKLNKFKKVKNKKKK
jgi:hypothetical protein